MRRWLSFSADRVAFAVAALIVGIAAEHRLYAARDVRHWLPDLLVGWILIGCGLAATGRPRLLLAGAGFSWFAGSFAAFALVLHRAPLAQLALTFPTGRSGRRLDQATIAAAYVISIATAYRLSDAGTVFLALGIVAVAARNYVAATGRLRRERAWALRVTSAYSALLCALVILNIGLTSQGDRGNTLLAYELALMLFAIYLTVSLREAPWREARVTDLVVELGETRVPTLRDALARALGDPTLDVAFRLDDGDYVDAEGRPFERRQDDARRVTPLRLNDREVALVVHDPAIVDDRELLDAVASAARLSGANAALQSEIRAQVAELGASRRRLLVAADDERRRLERRLHEGAGRRLAALGEMLAQLRGEADEVLGAQLVRAEAQLERAGADLRELAAGLHPRELVEDGLATALHSLADRSPVPVDLTVEVDRLPAEIEAAVYFACSETLANVAKYSNASRVAMTVVRRGGELHAEVADNGMGGASLEAGTGLRGLSDRVETIGGTFALDSPRGRGTRVVVSLPV